MPRALGLVRTSVLLLPLAACWGTDARTALSEEKQKDAMVEHHREVLGARDAIIAGDLRTAKSALGALAERLPLPGLDGPLQEALEGAASQGAAAEDLDGVSLALGDAAAVCGTCHKAQGTRPTGETGPAPEVGRDVKSQMALHRWASMRLWEGLVAGDDRMMQEATAALRSAPMVPSGTQVDSPLPPEATALEVKVHDLAAKAAGAPDARARGRAYGQMLATCARCHAMLDGGPK